MHVKVIPLYDKKSHDGVEVGSVSLLINLDTRLQSVLRFTPLSFYLPRIPPGQDALLAPETAWTRWDLALTDERKKLKLSEEWKYCDVLPLVFKF
jgi:hypothetical protein